MVILVICDSLDMEAGKEILGDRDGEQEAYSTRTSDRLPVSDDEDQRIIFPNSAFRPVKSSAECSPSFPQPQVLSPPPPPPPSSPGWYSSLLSSLYRTGAQHNNNIEQERDPGKKENEGAEGEYY